MKKNSFVEGAFIATAAVIVTKILGMLYVIPFYGIIGSQGGALYSYAYNIYTIFLDMSSAGIPTAISKIISEYNTLGLKEAKYRTFVLGRKIVMYLSMIGFLVMFLGADLIARFKRWEYCRGHIFCHKMHQFCHFSHPLYEYCERLYTGSQHRRAFECLQCLRADRSHIRHFNWQFPRI